MEDGWLNKAADLAARCEVLLTSHEPDAWKEPREPGYQYMGPGTKLKENVWCVQIQASIDWTELPSGMTSTTVKPAT